MLKYDRAILVPYLSNIFLLHLAIKKVDDHCGKISYELCRINGLDNGTRPLYIKKKPPLWAYLLIAFGIYPIFGILTGLREGFPGSLIFVLFLISAIPIAIGIGNIVSVRKNNAERYETFQRNLHNYEAKKRRIDEERKKIGPLENEKRKYLQEKKRIESVLGELYSANIIPSRYRDMYAAAYLYDWFSSGQSDDLDHALGMYVLEEVRARLDRVIAQQSEQLLRQNIQIGYQQKLIEQQENNSRIIQSKLDTIQATEEERLSYDKMMAGEAATVAYLAKADYIRRIL